MLLSHDVWWDTSHGINFCQKCQEVGVDGLILPDMPIGVYEDEYKEIFDKYGILNTFLITP